MKIFLSSTYNDLKEERNIVRELIEHYKHEVIWMEETPPGPRTTLEDSLDRVKICDCLIGIYAHKYGTIPDGYDKSIVEQEYDKACEMRLLTYGLVAGKEYKMVKENFEQEAEKVTKLERFKKNRLKKEITKEFNDINELIEKVKEIMNEIPPPLTKTKFETFIKPWHVERSILLKKFIQRTERFNIIFVSGDKGMGRRTIVANFLINHRNYRVEWNKCTTENSPKEVFMKLTQVYNKNLKPNILCEKLIATLRLRHTLLVLENFSREWIGLFLSPLIDALEKEDETNKKKQLRLIIISDDESLADDMIIPPLRIGPMETNEVKKLVRNYLEQKFFIIDNDGEIADQIADKCKRVPKRVLEIAENMVSEILISRYKSALFSGILTSNDLEIFFKYFNHHNNMLMVSEILLELVNFKEHPYSNTLIEVFEKELRWNKASEELRIEFHGKQKSSTVSTINGNLGVFMFVQSILNTLSLESSPVISDFGYRPQAIDVFLNKEKKDYLIRKHIQEKKEI